MGLKTGAAHFYHRYLEPALHSVKGLFRQSKVTKVAPDSSSLMSPHLQSSDIHKEAPKRKVSVHSDITPKVRRPSITATTESQNMAKIHFKLANGHEVPIKGVPLNASVATLRAQLSQITELNYGLGIPLNRLTKIHINGKVVSDSTPLWSCIDNQQSARITFTTLDKGKTTFSLKQDMETLLEGSDLQALFKKDESTLGQLNTCVYEFCQEITAGEVEPDDETVEELQDELQNLIQAAQYDEGLIDKEHVVAYLTQLNHMLTAVQQHDTNAYQPLADESVTSPPPPVDYSLKPEEKIKVDVGKMRRALGLDEATQPKSEQKRVKPVSVPLAPVEASKIDSKPTNNLGFVPLPMLVFDIEPEPKPESELIVDPFFSFKELNGKTEDELLTKTVTPAQQSLLNEELREVFEKKWSNQAGFNWAKATKLVKQGADPSSSLEVSHCPNPLFLVAANYAGDLDVRKGGDPDRILKLNCLREMLKHPNAAEAMKVIDKEGSGNTPLTRALALGDQTTATIMVDFIDKEMIRNNTVATILTQPDKQSESLAQNTPLMLALKTGCDQLAVKLMPFYSSEDIVGHKSLSGHDALDMICYRRLDELMRAVRFHAPEDRKLQLQALYLSDQRNSDLDKEIYANNMYLSERSADASNLASRPPVNQDVRENLDLWVQGGREDF